MERLVWADIESFLRNPGEILERLRERVSMQDSERQRRQKELGEFVGRLQQKTGERDRVLGLFRRGRIRSGSRLDFPGWRIGLSTGTHSDGGVSLFQAVQVVFAQVF